MYAENVKLVTSWNTKYTEVVGRRINDVNKGM